MPTRRGAAAGSGFDDVGLRGAASARVTDYLLGGKTHYCPDRALAEDLERGVPGLVRQAAVIGRAFGHATACAALARGVRQFLDLGCGLPTPWTGRCDLESPHRAVVQAGVRATVVCVDRDPVVLAHLRALSPGTPAASVTHIRGDVREMRRLLADPELVDALDLAEPIAVSLHDVLPWITGDEALAQSLTILRDWLPTGSQLSVTHLTADFQPERIATLADVYAAHGLPLRPRTRARIAALTGHWTPLGPGIAPTGQWHARHPHAGLPPTASAAYATIALKEPT